MIIKDGIFKLILSLNEEILSKPNTFQAVFDILKNLARELERHTGIHFYPKINVNNLTIEMWIKSTNNIKLDSPLFTLFIIDDNISFKGRGYFKDTYVQYYCVNVDLKNIEQISVDFLKTPNIVRILRILKG